LSKRLKVGILSFPWTIPATAYGGIERMIDHLCRGLKARDVDVYLWSATTSTCPVNRNALYEGTENLNGWHSAPMELNHVLAGYEWFQDKHVDIVHDITFAGPLVGPSLTNIPIVTTNYLPFVPPKPELGHSWPDLSRIYKVASQNATVLAISHSQANCAQGWQPRTILLGVDVNSIPFGDGSGDSEGTYAAFFARMSPEKGALTAIEAAMAAGIRLKIAARVIEPHEIDYFHEKVKPLIDGDQIQFVGELSLEQGYRFLGKACALLHPIAWPDTFGTSTVEALCCGTPVLALREGAVDEVIDDGITGAICSNMSQLAAQLRDYAKFDRAECRTTAERKFSNERVVDEHLSLYKFLIDNK
jgi:glycosyltransferase, family 1